MPPNDFSMKITALGSLLVLSVIIAGIVAMTPSVFADNPEITIKTAVSSGASSCESTTEGCYIPSTAIVDVGGKVVFSNADGIMHTFTSGVLTMVDEIGILFDSGLILTGSTYEWFPTKTGEFPYFYVVYPWITGMIIVEDAKNITQSSPKSIPQKPDSVNDLIAVTTDKPSYSNGEPIMISGKVKDLFTGFPVSLIIKSPNGNLILVKQVPVDVDKKFNYEFIPRESLNQLDGIYTIRVQYATENRIATTSFDYNKSAVESTIPNLIAVTTDKPSYSNGETIMISGKVKDDLFTGFPVSLIIKDPDGNLVRQDQSDIGVDKRFSFEHTAESSSMRVAGTYTITVQYGDENLATTSFDFGGSTTGPSEGNTPNTADQMAESSLYLEEQNEKLTKEIKKLKEESAQLKIELKRLKDQINDLQLKSAADELPSDKSAVVIDDLQKEATQSYNQVQSSIVVTVDKPSYSKGETITISGKVMGEPGYSSGTAVIFLMVSPDGDVIRIGDALPGDDQRFSFEHTAGGSSMKLDGVYTIEVLITNLKTATSFEYTQSAVVDPTSFDSDESTLEEMAESIPMSYAGTFVGVDDGIHDAQGDAYTIPLEDASNVLRLENFRSTNGPDLYVYLSTDDNASDFVNLGALKANNGNQNYEIPDGTDLSKYNKVLVWCKAFSVLFGSAELSVQ